MCSMVDWSLLSEIVLVSQFCAFPSVKGSIPDLILGTLPLEVSKAMASNPEFATTAVRGSPTFRFTPQSL